MNYEEDVIPYLTQLIGSDLLSISGQSDIHINNVTTEGVSIRCQDGKSFFEYHKRVKSVLHTLLEKGVIHVDAAMNGSGSRRNIPETLLANLPCIEHGKIGGTKHLYLKNEDTHLLGTLKMC